MTAWVLIAYMSTGAHGGGGPLVIDNIATWQDCAKVQQILQRSGGYAYTSCIPVKKVKS